MNWDRFHKFAAALAAAEKNPEKRVRHWRRLIARLDRQAEDCYPHSAYARSNLAKALDESGEHCAAAIAAEEALAIHRAHGEHISDRVVRCHNRLAALYLRTGRPAEAEAAFREGLMILDHLPEEKQVGRGYLLHGLSRVYRSFGDEEAAVSLLHDVVRLHMRYLGLAYDVLAVAFMDFADIYSKQGQHAAALKAAYKSRRFMEWAKHTDRYGYAVMLAQCGLIESRAGLAEAAKSSLLQSLENLNEIRPPDHYFIAKVQGRLAPLEERYSTKSESDR